MDGVRESDHVELLSAEQRANVESAIARINKAFSLQLTEFLIDKRNPIDPCPDIIDPGRERLAIRAWRLVGQIRMEGPVLAKALAEDVPQILTMTGGGADICAVVLSQLIDLSWPAEGADTDTKIAIVLAAAATIDRPRPAMQTIQAIADQRLDGLAGHLLKTHASPEILLGAAKKFAPASPLVIVPPKDSLGSITLANCLAARAMECARSSDQTGVEQSLRGLMLLTDGTSRTAEKARSLLRTICPGALAVHLAGRLEKGDLLVGLSVMPKVISMESKPIEPGLLPLPSSLKQAHEASGEALSSGVIDHRWGLGIVSVQVFRDAFANQLGVVMAREDGERAIMLAATMLPDDLCRGMSLLLNDANVQSEMRDHALLCCVNISSDVALAQRLEIGALAALPRIMTSTKPQIAASRLAKLLLPKHAASVRVRCADLGKVDPRNSHDLNESQCAAVAMLALQAGMAGQVSDLSNLMNLPGAWPILLASEDVPLTERLQALATAFPGNACRNPALVLAASALVRRAGSAGSSQAVLDCMASWISSPDDEVSLCASAVCVEVCQSNPTLMSSIADRIRARWPNLLGGD